MVDFENLEQEATKISRFNSASLINFRLHELWKDANKHSRQGKYSSWNFDLDCIWRELGGDEKPEGDNVKAFKKLSDELNKNFPIKNWKGSSGFEKTSPGDEKKKIKQYQLLQDKELFLRRLQNTQGKGTAYADDTDSYMDG